MNVKLNETEYYLEQNKLTTTKFSDQNSASWSLVSQSSKTIPKYYIENVIYS